VEGKTLRQMIPVQKMQDAISYAIQIGEALQEAHSKGVVHRDIKTDNIMVNSKNQVKVMDFGLAKLKGSLKLTKTSSTVGTLAYMAPEQIQGEEVDARSDIFSFGVVLYEMLTGHLPFRGEHDAAMMYSIMNEEPEPLQHYIADAPSELSHILDRAVEKDREDRYQTVHDMLIDLRRLKKDSARVSRQPHYDTPVAGTALPAPAVEQKKGWRKRLWVGATGVVVLCVIAVLLLLLKTPAVRLNPNRTSVTVRIPFKEISCPSLSRDGNWVAFPARDENGKWDVYLMNTAGGKPNRVTDESASYIETVGISPDVSQIAYDCWNEPNTNVKVKVVASQGGGSRTLADTGATPRWSPDGTRIGYLRLGWGPVADVSGKLEIWSIRSDGTDSRVEFIDTVTTRSPTAFSWSPDGGSITWVRNYLQGYGEVMARELATGKERQLTSDRKTVDEATWAANDAILFISTRSGQSNLWMIPSAGGEATQVTQGGVPIFAARISGDNKTVVYTQWESIAHIWITGIDGSNARQLTSGDLRVTSASFSRDGKHVSYVVADVDYRNPEAHLFVMDRDGRNQRQLTSGSETVGYGKWSPDGKWLAYSSQGLGEPEDSTRVYLIQPVNPGPPLLLCKATSFRWLDSESLVVLSQMKTLQYSTRGGTSTQVYQDSTFAFPIQGNKQLAFYDFRKGREGWWIVSIDSLRIQKGEAKRVGPLSSVVAPHDWRFWIYRKPQGNELWRVWTSTGREERIGKALPGEAYMWDVSTDGKEILWIRREGRSKLVLVKNVFE
jgi:Tol biopolymer transport system component